MSCIITGRDALTFRPGTSAAGRWFVRRDWQRSSRADRIWRVKSRSGGDWIYLFVRIEFQSRVDPMMARRVLNYVLRAREQAEGERRGRAASLASLYLSRHLMAR